MREIGIRDLKAHLSRYLRDVQAGDVIRVTDRGRVVAELRQPDTAATRDDSLEAKLDQLAKEGLLRRATGPRLPYTPAPVQLEDGTTLQWLDEMRGDR